ncbi:hypothetical protein AYI68_g6873 [Smittium mucronatum]|uniref:Uncharacterized protein n=1 Tax=Smittium mucronatum TaxID=133383 RepID=A0A1R0GQ95_9FUNG|nr:hypothetical protein AYI68_g6873 [Smittium mucronatum]
MDQGKSDFLIANKKPEKPLQIFKPFRGRRYYSTHNGARNKPAQVQTVGVRLEGVNKGCFSRPLYWDPSRSPPRDVSVSMEQTTGKKVGPKHGKEEVIDPINEIISQYKGCGDKWENSFCIEGPLERSKSIQAVHSTKKTERLEDVAASKNSSNGVSTTEKSPMTTQEKYGST